MVKTSLITLRYFFILIFLVAMFMGCRNQKKLNGNGKIDLLLSYPDSAFVLPDTISIDSLKKLIKADTNINEIRSLLDSLIERYESE